MRAPREQFRAGASSVQGLWAELKAPCPPPLDMEKPEGLLWQPPSLLGRTRFARGAASDSESSEETVDLRRKHREICPVSPEPATTRASDQEFSISKDLSPLSSIPQDCTDLDSNQDSVEEFESGERVRHDDWSDPGSWPEHLKPYPAEPMTFQAHTLFQPPRRTTDRVRPGRSRRSGRESRPTQPDLSDVVECLISGVHRKSLNGLTSSVSPTKRRPARTLVQSDSESEELPTARGIEQPLSSSPRPQSPQSPQSPSPSPKRAGLADAVEVLMSGSRPTSPLQVSHAPFQHELADVVEALVLGHAGQAALTMQPESVSDSESEVSFETAGPSGVFVLETPRKYQIGKPPCMFGRSHVNILAHPDIARSWFDRRFPLPPLALAAAARAAASYQSVHFNQKFQNDPATTQPTQIPGFMVLTGRWNKASCLEDWRDSPRESPRAAPSRHVEVDLESDVSVDPRRSLRSDPSFQRHEAPAAFFFDQAKAESQAAPVRFEEDQICLAGCQRPEPEPKGCQCLRRCSRRQIIIVLAVAVLILSLAVLGYLTAALLRLGAFRCSREETPFLPGDCGRRLRGQSLI
ncbi:unnamed protein product [Effrenium voratum]|uniref:Uncharacterized protein n=1 Tax=Effrenium voratum TaxID=2562239 RepID=A0AA36IN87_9DINO|nr:unnamed protein product [Effrenium voratum]CAJ1418640.1 unnamed protein product [Effrenium voratum]